MVGVLKKEVMKTQSKELEKGAEYRQLLVQAIHSWCALQPLWRIWPRKPVLISVGALVGALSLF